MKLLTQIKEDLDSHSGEWTRPGFLAIAFHRFGNWRMKIDNKVLRAPFSIIYRFLYRRARNIYGIELPYSVKLGRRVIIEHQGGIVIHGSSVIGDGCIIRQGVTLGNRNLDDPFAAPVLGNNVNVGAGAKILGAISLGDNCSVGANAVIMKDVPSGALAVGVPAKIIER